MNNKELILSFAKKIYLKTCVVSSKFKKTKIPELPPKKNTRILIISTDDNKTSGAFLCLVNMCEYLIMNHGLEVYVILPYRGNGRSFLKSKNIPFYTINSFGWCVELSRNRDKYYENEVKNKKIVNNNAINDIRRFIRNNDIDLVHINSSYNYVGAVASLNENTPFIWHIREFLEEDQGNTMWDRKKGNELINKSDCVIAVSDSIYDKYSQFIDNDKLLTIYDGVDANIFYNPHKEILQEDTVKLIFIGSIEMHKGILDFCNACVKLFKEGYKNIEINVIGDGEEELKTKIKDIFSLNNMKNNVNLLGYQKNVAEHLEKSDIFCMCSKSEAFGRTTTEAMLSGNLVIGAQSGGTKDIITNNQTGMLYKPGDINELCEKIIFAIENREHSKKLAKNGREYIFENMTAEINAEKIYEVYNEILYDK